MLTAKEVCEELKISARTLANWRREGLPYEAEKGKFLYDADTLAGWLLATGKAKRQGEEAPLPPPEAPVFTKIREVAQFFNVNSRTVKVWLEDPSFPGRPGTFREGVHARGNFPTRAIADWLQQPGRKLKVQIPESLRRPEVHAVTPTSRDQLVEVKTEQAKLELRKMQGKMVDAEEAQAFFTRVNSYTVTVLSTLAPRLIASLPSGVDERMRRAIFETANKVVDESREMIAELIEGDRDASPGLDDGKVSGDEHRD